MKILVLNGSPHEKGNTTALAGPVVQYRNMPLGRMRGAIRGYMQEMVAAYDRFLLFDGHRILSASQGFAVRI